MERKHRIYRFFAELTFHSNSNGTHVYYKTGQQVTKIDECFEISDFYKVMHSLYKEDPRINLSSSETFLTVKLMCLSIWNGCLTYHIHLNVLTEVNLDGFGLHMEDITNRETVIKYVPRTSSRKHAETDGSQQKRTATLASRIMQILKFDALQ